LRRLRTANWIFEEGMMNFFVMLCIVIVFSAGVLGLTLEASPKTFRFAQERRFGIDALRKKLNEAAKTAQRGALYLKNTKKEEQVNKEIYTALSVLRNHASADTAENAAVTTDYILEQFALSEGILAKPYAGALRHLRTGRREEAIESFTTAAGVELARDFIMLVLDWDAVPPHKLKKTVVAFQNALKETRTTTLVRKNEALSDLVYLPVVACVLVIFVNFIYVAYFAEQRALLAELFF